MNTTMNVQAKSGSGLSFAIKTGSGHSMLLDTADISPEESQGPCPTELLLAALAGCAGMAIMPILHKMKQTITEYTIQVTGEKTPQPPQIFHTITVEHHFSGPNINADVVKRALELVEKRYCSVGAMLEANVHVTHVAHVHPTSITNTTNGDIHGST
ncbi:OsmC family protein [Dictyobacter kobayashii]|uniref:OsmC-like protein n=1 Tax=Dictyobacter kobayashii TaxID=2014872 RepID=A0A402AUX9_9CHLR|nr:OsmC family protein [Dictyobacter kobayashii]GCE22885.1 OsmC-like protein [Dictyobacter kobayashii]